MRKFSDDYQEYLEWMSELSNSPEAYDHYRETQELYKLIDENLGNPVALNAVLYEFLHGVTIKGNIEGE